MTEEPTPGPTDGTATVWAEEPGVMLSATRRGGIVTVRIFDVPGVADRKPSREAAISDSRWQRIEAVCGIAAAPALAQENRRLREGASKQNDEICQALGKALGYPWFKDDQKNFPGATEMDGVCIGDHVAESMADEAARKVGALVEENAGLREEVGRLRAIIRVNMLRYAPEITHQQIDAMLGSVKT